MGQWGELSSGMLLLLAACSFCEPGTWSNQVFGGGSASITLHAEADDGIEAFGEDTGAPAELLEASATPEDDTWVLLDETTVYVEVCVVADVDGCPAATICLESSYLPAEWIDGAPHDIAQTSGLYVMGEAKGYWDVTEATITMDSAWSGSASFGPFTWEEVTPECLTKFGSTSAEIVWELDPDVSVTHDGTTGCE